MKTLCEDVEALAKLYEEGHGGFVVAEVSVAMKLRALLSAPEPPREELREKAINKALDRIAFLTDSGDYHGYRSEIWIAVAEVFDAALSPAPAKAGEPFSITHGRLQHDRIASIRGKAREIDLLCCALTGLEPVTFDDLKSAKPPAPKRWRCKGCGAKLHEIEIVDNGHMIDGLHCGPVVEEVSDE